MCRPKADGYNVLYSYLNLRAKQYREEALLPQTDRATRYVSRSCQLLHNCRKSCTTNRPTQEIEAMELEHYDRSTCIKLCASMSHDASTVVWEVSTNWTVDELCWQHDRNFLSLEFHWPHAAAAAIDRYLLSARSALRSSWPASAGLLLLGYAGTDRQTDRQTDRRTDIWTDTVQHTTRATATKWVRVHV